MRLVLKAQFHGAVADLPNERGIRQYEIQAVRPHDADDQWSLVYCLEGRQGENRVGKGIPRRLREPHGEAVGYEDPALLLWPETFNKGCLDEVLIGCWVGRPDLAKERNGFRELEQKAKLA